MNYMLAFESQTHEGDFSIGKLDIPDDVVNKIEYAGKKFPQQKVVLCVKSSDVQRFSDIFNWAKQMGY